MNEYNLKIVDIIIGKWRKLSKENEEEWRQLPQKIKWFSDDLNSSNIDVSIRILEENKIITSKHEPLKMIPWLFTQCFWFKNKMINASLSVFSY